MKNLNKFVRPTRLILELLEDRTAPAAGPWSFLTFDGLTAGSASLPGSWSRWSSTSDQFQVSTTAALSGTKGLTIPAGTSSTVARAWDGDIQPPDVQVSAAVNLKANQLTPAQASRGAATSTGAGSAQRTMPSR